MRESLRKSGIDIIGDVPWGTHFCQFYQTKEDLVDMLVPYFKAGLENNEFCLWVTAQPLEVEDAKEAMKKVVPDIDVYLGKGQMEIIPYTHGYIKEGIFDQDKVVGSWVEKIDQALARGYDGLRASGDNRWLEKEGWDDFVDYEEKVDAIIGKHHVIALCPYYLDMCSTAEIIDVVSNHQFTLIKKEGKWEQIENSGRKRAENEAIQAAKDWKHTFDAVPDLVAIIDNECRIVRANRAMAARLGVTPEECVGLTCYRVIHGTDEPPSFCPHRQLLEDGAEHTSEVCEDCLGGYFAVSTTPLHDSEGKLIGSIYVARNITERKKAEEKIQILANAVESSEDAIITKSLDGIITSWNKGAEKVYGYLAGETLGKNISMLEPDDLKGQIKYFSEKIKHGERIQHYETLRLKKDGTKINVSVTFSPVFDTSGKLVAISTIARNITERKRSEEALRLSNIYNRSLIEASLDPLVTIGHDGKITDVNRATELVTGSSRNDLIGTDFSDYFTEPEEARKGYQQVFIDGEVRDYPLEIQHKDGHTTPVLYNASVYKDEAGKVIGIFAAARDITERKKAEEAVKKIHDNLEKLVKERTAELEKAYESLKESETGLAEAQKMAHIGSWNWNIATDKAHWSDELYRIFGLNPQEIAPDQKELFKYIHPDDREYVDKTFKEGLKGKQTASDIRIILANWEERTIHVQTETIFGEDNIPIQVKGITQDITERIKSEEALEKMDKIRIKEIHHRIKNNLQVISSLLDLQAERFQNKEVLEAFRESQNRITSMSLIHEELYKGEGKDTLNFSAYLQKLAENLFQTYNLKSKNVRLCMDLEENTLFDMDVAVPLGIIVNELVSNSLKHAFTEDGKGEIRIRLCREEKNDEMHKSFFSLTISDNGKGIPESIKLEKLESLGLQLVNILVDQLEGKIELRRTHGTEFRITFTVAERS